MPHKKEEMMKVDMECCKRHRRMKGIGLIVLGLLILMNVYWAFIDWAGFIGAVLVLGGFLKLVIPHKHHR